MASRMKVSLLMGLWLVASGCDKLSDEECLKLRGEAFEALAPGLTCLDDGECAPTDWPGCAKPANTKVQHALAEFKASFDKGSCVEEAPVRPCGEVPEVYCKQGLCVFRHLAASGH